MDQSTLPTSTYADLVELGRRLYERSLVRHEDEEITDPRGQPIGWLLDTRVPMLDGEMFGEVGAVLADRLRAKGERQVAGYGFGSFGIVSAVLSAEGADGSGEAPPFKGGFIRKERKGHGRSRLVEGPLRRDEPVVLMDDSRILRALSIVADVARYSEEPIEGEVELDEHNSFRMYGIYRDVITSRVRMDVVSEWTEHLPAVDITDDGAVVDNH
ncbi:MAG: hypothetical protein BRD48_05355, partial [Bacteroidetes bacterium QS_9_68_14]